MRSFYLLWLFVVAACGGKGQAEQLAQVQGQTPTLQAELPAEERVEVREASPATPLKDLLAQEKAGANDVSLYVDKSDYTLEVRVNGKTLKTYPIVLGRSPEGDKRMQGDCRTPEGDFAIISKYEHANWHKFIWFNYPTAVSWQRFKDRKASGEIPKDAKIGGEVGIHGVPEGYDTAIDFRQNWTLGCIALKNEHIDDFYPFVAKDTKLVIVP